MAFPFITEIKGCKITWECLELVTIEAFQEAREEHDRKVKGLSGR